MKKCLEREQEMRPSFINIQNEFEERFEQEEKMKKMLQKSNVKMRRKKSDL